MILEGLCLSEYSQGIYGKRTTVSVGSCLLHTYCVATARQSKAAAAAANITEWQHFSMFS
ncbi:hypothetical protein D3C72_129690 [compost metagenome]